MKQQSTREEVSDLRTHTGFWLRFVSNAVSYGFARKLEGSGVTVAEWVVLREMFGAGATSPSAVAASTGLTRGAISKLVDRLVQKGLVSRAEATVDRRFQDVALTEAGRALVPKLAAIADRNDGEFFASLSGEERERLMTTLKKLVMTNHLERFPTS